MTISWDGSTNYRLIKSTISSLHCSVLPPPCAWALPAVLFGSAFSWWTSPPTYPSTLLCLSLWSNHTLAQPWAAHVPVVLYNELLLKSAPFTPISVQIILCHLYVKACPNWRADFDLQTGHVEKQLVYLHLKTESHWLFILQEAEINKEYESLYE